MLHRKEVVGFVVLDRAAHMVSPDWEAFDLLRAAGRQAASYLAEEQSTKVLRDSELLTEYSKRFAFVVHDIKNLASQLNLIVSNAAKHIGDPAFQRDMLADERDDVGCFANPGDVVVEDAHARRIWAGCAKSRLSGDAQNKSQTPRGRFSGRHPSSSTPRPSA